MSTTVTLDRQTVRAAMTSAVVFARVLVGRELWPHQREVAESDARYRVICAGRQVGKSLLLAIIALWEAYRRPGITVLIVSAGEVASKRLLADVTSMAVASPLLAGAVADEQSSVVTLSNGSTIRSVPASQRQIRGWPVDVLIVDEAGFLDPEVWRAAEPSIIARPGSKVILSSSPWGNAEHFFRRLWKQGMGDPSEQVRSWHWPSDVSPLVDRELLEQIRQRESPIYFAREFLAQWTDDKGAFFTQAEVTQNVADFEMIDPPRAQNQLAVAGVDWGVTHDASTVVVLGVLAGSVSPLNTREPVFGVVHVGERFGSDLRPWAEHVAELSDPEAGGFDMIHLASEVNGIGIGANEMLQSAFKDRGLIQWRARPVSTTAKRKVTAAGIIKLLLQQGRLVLPRSPSLLRQLAGMQQTVTAEGNLRLSVPEPDHDDVIDGLMQAIACIRHVGAGLPSTMLEDARTGDGEWLETDMGVRVRERPRLANYPRAFVFPRKPDDDKAGW